MADLQKLQSHDMRSTRVVSRQRKLDDFIKSELQRLNSRLDATDVRIQRLIGGEVPANPKQFLDTWPCRDVECCASVWMVAVRWQ